MTSPQALLLSWLSLSLELRKGKRDSRSCRFDFKNEPLPQTPYKWKTPPKTEEQQKGVLVVRKPVQHAGDPGWGLSPGPPWLCGERGAQWLTCCQGRQTDCILHVSDRRPWASSLTSSVGAIGTGWNGDSASGWRLALKNWCFWTVVLEKTLESPLDCEEIQPVHSEGDQPWDFFGGNDAKAETPVLWPPHVKSWLIGKGSDAGRDWGQEKGTTEDEMAGWHHWLDGRESEWTPGVGDGQGEAWRAAIHGVAKSRTRLSDWTELTEGDPWKAWTTSVKL